MITLNDFVIFTRVKAGLLTEISVEFQTKPFRCGLV